MKVLKNFKNKFYSKLLNSYDKDKVEEFHK